MGEVLIQIHEEMSELLFLDKQMNVQTESLKIKLLESTQAPASPQKVCDENERKKKKDCNVIFVKGMTL